MPILFPNSPTNGQTVTISGVSYSWNSTKSTWDLVVSTVVGATGPQGLQGSAGATGAAGTNGTNGAAATITVGTTTTGAAGSSASVTNSGATSAATFNFTIPQGATGATGATGPAGADASLTQTTDSKTANYTIVAGDKFKLIRSTSTAITITIANVLAVGEGIDFLQDGTGQITFVAGAGATLLSADSLLKTAKQYAGATVRCVASGQYRLIGNLG